MNHPRHRTPSRPRAILALTAALVLVAGALFYSANRSSVRVPVASQLEVVGTDVCTRTIYSDGSSDLHCPPPVSPSGSPSPSTVPPSATPTPTQPPTTPPPTTVPPTTVPPTTTPPVTTPPVTTPPPTTTPPSGCPVAGKNVPGAADPWGGCWPGPGNTGVPTGTVLTNYTGPCTITAANFVIDHKLVTCSSLLIKAANVTITMSMLQNVDLDNGDIPAPSSYTIVDSTVVNGAREQCGCVAGHDFTALRLNIVGGNRSSYCQAHCVIQDSWLHGQQLQGAQHGSGLREEQFTTARHDSLVCDFNQINDATSLGCSADLTGYADFAPIHDNTISRNLFLSAVQGNCASCQPGHPPYSFCAYGGASAGKPYSSDPANATNQVFLENVFQRGSLRNGGPGCGDWGPVGDFAVSRPGNVFQGNVWADTGTAVPAG